ncbi:MAG TPA: DUF1080 domain-containing protein [Armatimonadota bacterium]|jgi:hypothetical protein
MKFADYGFVAALAVAVAVPALAKGAPDTRVLGVGGKPPEGAVVLYDGKNTDAWSRAWKIEKDKSMLSGGGGDNASKEKFLDGWYHVEWKEPLMADKTGQERGNSGVYLQGRYEVQVLDSYGITDPGRGDCGAIYDTAAPLVNACKPPLEWQAYDIFFKAPRYDADGKKIENARLTVFQNGILVQNNTEAPHPTRSATDPEGQEAGPLVLQDHGTPVTYRNVWVKPLPLKGAGHY